MHQLPGASLRARGGPLEAHEGHCAPRGAEEEKGDWDTGFFTSAKSYYASAFFLKVSGNGGYSELIFLCAGELLARLLLKEKATGWESLGLKSVRYLCPCLLFTGKFPLPVCLFCWRLMKSVPLFVNPLPNQCIFPKKGTPPKEYTPFVIQFF